MWLILFKTEPFSLLHEFLVFPPNIPELELILLTALDFWQGVDLDDLVSQSAVLLLGAGIPDAAGGSTLFSLSFGQLVGC